MKSLYRITVALLVVVLAGCAGGLERKEGWYTNIVDEAFVKQYAVVPKPDRDRGHHQADLGLGA